MDIGSELLSQVVTFTKYARWLPDANRRETWPEIVARSEAMHHRKYSHLQQEITQAFDYVRRKQVLPSMRGLQFAGKAVELNAARLYNCSFLPVDSWEAFHETCFLLLAGTGVGVSVQQRHVDQLPEITKPAKTKRFLIQDSILGWADAVKALMKAYFLGKPLPLFDYSDIRAKGMPLITSGGIAPGPEPLQDCLHNLNKVLARHSSGDKLTSLEAHDLICYIGDCILSGGVRRSAVLSLFDLDDDLMLTSKFGEWYKLNPQRARANNSAVLLRHRITEDAFTDLWGKIQYSGSGEPGFMMSNDQSWGTNPCQPATATVLTPAGISTIGQVSVGDLIWSGTKWTKIVAKWSTGVKKCYKFTTSAGVFVGTANHIVISNGRRVQADEATDLDQCAGPEFTLTYHLDHKQYTMDGMVVGDGTILSKPGTTVGLYIGSKDDDYFTSPVAPLIRDRPVARTLYKVDSSITAGELPKTYNRCVPDRYFYGAPVQVAMFLKGLYSANGTVKSDGKVALKAASLTIIEQVQLMLSSLGIRSYYTANRPRRSKFPNGYYTSRANYDLNITLDRRKFLERVNFVQKYKQAQLRDICLHRDTGTPKTSYAILDRKYLGELEVFDLTVDDPDHTYWTGGLLVSNCGEIALKPHQMCNLCDINTATIESQEDLNERAKAAAFIATLQAGYTNFHYLRDVWQRTVERDALIGIGLTGIATGRLTNLDLTAAAKIVKTENARVAKLIGINPAARCTTVKPSGTSSSVLGSSSGIHAWHSPYYVRRMRLNKMEPIYQYLVNQIPDLVEDDYFKPHTDAILSLPIQAPEGATTREESAIDLLDRVSDVYRNWIVPGHRSGHNRNNVSCTVSVKPDEWAPVGQWMWRNRDHYGALSVLPYDYGSYKQPPFEEITRDQYLGLVKSVHQIDLTQVHESEDLTVRQAELACSGNACDVTY